MPKEGIVMQEDLIQNSVEDTVEDKKQWVAPELKKLDVEEVTAHGSLGDNDTLGFS